MTRLLAAFTKRMARMRLKTQGRVLLVLAFIPAVTIPATVASLYERQLLYDAATSRARLLTESLASSALEPLLNYDTPRLDDVVESIRVAPGSYEDLYEAMVLDADGRIVAYARPSFRQGRPQYADYGEQPADPFSREAIASPEPELVRRKGKHLDVSKAIDIGGKRWGTVIVRTDLTRMHATILKDLVRNFAVASLIGLLIGGFVGLVFRPLFLYPMYRMVEAAEALGRRDFHHRIDHERKDEIGEVYESMNRAAILLQEREKLYATFGRYVTNQVRDAILSGTINSKGQHVKAAVIFADLRGFTSRSEGRPAEDVLDLLNRYCSRMTTAIHAHGGIVDKFIGDAIMAVFGVPFADADCATKAVMAVDAMRGQLDELNAELAASGMEPLRMGVGVHVGDCVAGAVGPPTRQQYTVVGDTVNLAARLQVLTKKFGVDVLITDEVRKACADWAYVRDLGETSVDGREGHVHVYQLVSTKLDRRESNDAIARERMRERESAG